jgi:hypothetical protein
MIYTELNVYIMSIFVVEKHPVEYIPRYINKLNFN